MSGIQIISIESVILFLTLVIIVISLVLKKRVFGIVLTLIAILQHLAINWNSLLNALFWLIK